MRTGNHSRLLILVTALMIIVSSFTFTSFAEGDETVVNLVDIVDVWTALEYDSEFGFSAEINPNAAGLTDQIAIEKEEWFGDDGSCISSDNPKNPSANCSYSYSITVRAKEGYIFDPESGFVFVLGGTEYDTSNLSVGYNDENHAVSISGFIDPVLVEGGDEAEDCTDYEYRLIGNGEIEITKYIGSEIDVSIPEEIGGHTVTSIADFAFNRSSINKLKIEGNVEHIGKFGGIGQFVVTEDNPNYSARGGVLFNKEGTELVLYPGERNSVHYSVPNGTIIIGENAFAFTRDRIRQLDLPETVTEIKKNALPDVRRLYLVLPKSLSSLDENSADNKGKNYTIYFRGTEDEWKALNADFYGNAIMVFKYDKTGLKISKTTVNCTLGERPFVTLTYSNGDPVKEEDIRIYDNDDYDIASLWFGNQYNKIALHIYPYKIGTLKACIITGGFAQDITVNITGETPVGKTKINGLESSVVYTGKPIVPSLSVYVGNNFINYNNYTYVLKNNTKVGTAKLTITGKRRLSGSITKTFKILPKGTSIKSVSSAKNAFTVTWNKNAKETSGYQIQYGLKKDLSDGKTVRITNNKTVKRKISKLKAKK